jgi:hypothetical protein
MDQRKFQVTENLVRWKLLLESLWISLFQGTTHVSSNNCLISNTVKPCTYTDNFCEPRFLTCLSVEKSQKMLKLSKNLDNLDWYLTGVKICSQSQLTNLTVKKESILTFWLSSLRVLIQIFFHCFYSTVRCCQVRTGSTTSSPDQWTKLIVDQWWILMLDTELMKKKNDRNKQRISTYLIYWLKFLIK